MQYFIPKTTVPATSGFGPRYREIFMCFKLCCQLLLSNMKNYQFLDITVFKVEMFKSVELTKNI
jgi:hypothetical protein